MSESSYYVPHGSKWPMVGTIGICTAMVGAANLFNGGN